MDQVKVGTLLPTNDAQERDAIHIAVVSMIADEILPVGARVGFVDGTERATTQAGELLGVVDPFLREPVKAGQRFWMFLYPNTIIGLRHHWAHPAFGDMTPKQIAEHWIAQFAARLDYTPAQLMDAASQYNDCDDYTMDNTERYKDASNEEWETFWRHWQTITRSELSADVKRWSGAPFTCSC